MVARLQAVEAAEEGAWMWRKEIAATVKKALLEAMADTMAGSGSLVLEAALLVRMVAARSRSWTKRSDGPSCLENPGPRTIRGMRAHAS